MGLFKATVSAVRAGLSRTRAAITTPLGGLLQDRTLDANTIAEIESALLQADVGVATTTAVVEDLRSAVAAGSMQRGQDGLLFLRERLTERLRRDQPTLAKCATPPTVILVAGVNGVGKTTSVAKIAYALQQEGRKVLVGAADTYRAAAVDQLETWSARLGFDLVRGQTGADPAAVAFDATKAAMSRGADVLLVDTAGRMHTEQGLMRQLQKIQTVIRKQIPDAPHEVLLVLDATQGQNALIQAQAFQQAVDVTGIVLTKLDGTARGGIALAIQADLDIPVKLVGLGERPEDIEAFDPAAFVEALLEA